MKGIEMYFNTDITERFAELEQCEKHHSVSQIIDQVIIHEVGNQISPNFKACELGGGAHPDRYHNLFELLIKNSGHIDRVDISPFMLQLGKQYLSKDIYKERLEVISFVMTDIIAYLQSILNKSLNVAIMKYTLDHINDIDTLFSLIHQKLKISGKMRLYIF